MDSPNFDAPEWSTTVALAFIFFSGTAEYETPEGRNQQRRQIRLALKNTTPNSPIKPVSDESDLHKKIRKLKSEFPELTNLPKPPPLIWIKLAFEALRKGMPPTKIFFKRFGIWRFENSLLNKRQIVIQKNSNISFIALGTETDGTTLDYFILTNNFHLDLKNTLQWKIADIEKSKRELIDIVGTRSYNDIKDAIDNAAKSKTIKQLSHRRTNGKYTTTLSRAELAEKLKKIYKDKLPAESTILRALSDFVSCSQK